MKFFTLEWWGSCQDLDTIADAQRAFDQYEQSLDAVRARVPETDHWLLSPSAIHDARNIELNARSFDLVTLRVDAGHMDIHGEVVITFEAPTSVHWFGSEPVADSIWDPPITLGYHEFSLAEDDQLRYNALFWPGSELEIVCRGFRVTYTPCSLS